MPLTFSELRDLAVKHGFPDPDTAAAVAMAESSGDPHAEGDRDPAIGPSRGLWQININRKAHPEYATANLFDPDVNAQAAFAVSSGGTNWKPWSTFNSGAYKKYMPAPAGPSVVGDDGQDFFDDEESDA